MRAYLRLYTLLILVMLWANVLNAQEINSEEQAALASWNTTLMHSKIIIMNKLCIAAYYSAPKNAFE